MPQRFVVASTPEKDLEVSHFRLESFTSPDLEDGQIRVKNHYISIDAANRAWLQSATYRPQILPGEPMAGLGVGEVIESRSSEFDVGDHIIGDFGWTDEWSGKPFMMRKTIPYDGPLSHHLSALDITGKTAWHGLCTVANPKAGNTLVVSAAAGATGCLVGQFGKALGMHVVGIAGSREKCDHILDLGFDAAVCYKDADFYKQLAAATPGRVNLYFDNVGGEVLDTVLARMALFGEIVCCGAVSQYNTDNPQGPTRVPGVLVISRITMKGFVVMDHADKDPEAVEQITGWIKDGTVQIVEDVLDGLEKTPEGLLGMLNGDNTGKRLIRVS